MTKSTSSSRSKPMVKSVTKSATSPEAVKERSVDKKKSKPKPLSAEDFGFEPRDE
ncbi:MAG: hypothetical protein ACXABY_21515 [Candidatus Thorarchaeota archaeon]|jgi:hypothetical protein